jgi:NDP-sugar pyrophosphorylase family protein
MIMLPAVILAGGLATRLRPLTETIPKALVNINGEPFIAHQLRLLRKQGFTDVFLCVGYLHEMIESYVSDGEKFGINVTYVQDGPRLLGTGGAIKNALKKIKTNSFFVLYGDSYLPCDYSAVQKFFVNSNKLGLMTVFHNENKWDASNVEFLNQEIVVYDKKNKSSRMKYIDYGLGILTKESFAYLHDQEIVDLAFLYQLLLEKNLLAGYEIKERFYEAGSFTGIEELAYYLSEKTGIPS